MWLLLILALTGGPQDPGAPPPPPPMSIAEYGRLVRERNPPRPDAPIPERAFASPLWWEQDQCGVEPTDDCLRNARNRLAMARVERMEAEAAQPAPAPARPAAPPRCRTVTRPAESGVGGSISRVCGDGDGSDSARILDDLMRDRSERTQPSCDRPAQGESQALWIDRCRAFP